MSQVDHPSHYGGKENQYETIKVLRAWLGDEAVKNFCHANALKYLSRAGKKDAEKQDIEKAIWYLNYIVNELMK